jgi:hypothetical protein
LDKKFVKIQNSLFQDLLLDPANKWNKKPISGYNTQKNKINLRTKSNSSFQPIALEGYSEDDNQDGFVDPIGQVAPVVYAAPHYGYAAPFGYAGLPYAHHVVPAVKAVEAPKVEVKAAPAPVLYAAGYPHVYAAHHVVTHPITYTHTVPAGVLTHTVVGGVLPAFAARTVAIAAPATAEAVVEA